MPKNKGKGGKNRRRGKNENDPMKRDIFYADEEQKYAQVEKATGSGRLEIQVFRFENNSWAKDVRVGLIRGSLRKKVWIGTGDIILVATREYQEDMLDVVHKYFPEEVQDLKSKGLVPPDAGMTVRDGVDDMAKAEQMNDAQAAWEFGAIEQDENEELGKEERIDIDEI